MSFEPLPARPPAGKLRYKAICRDPKQNPFKPGLLAPSGMVTQTVDIDATTSRAQVEKWAREAAAQKGYVFVELEDVRT